MVKITTGQLVEFANERRLPPIFEKGWEGTYMLNPVVLAIQHRSAAKNLLWATGASVAAAVFVGQIQLAAGIVPVGAMVGTFAFFASLISFRNAAKLSSGFRANLALAIEWLGYKTPEIAFERRDEELRQVANGTLVIAAAEVLKLEKEHAQPRTPEELSQKTETLSDLACKYQTFLLLGLVPQGGYGRYFEQAEKEITKAA